MVSLPPSRYLLRARELVDAHYAEPITVADMAEAARLSPAHFSREFKAAYGESPHQYLLTRRLERAASLLRNTDWSVARICTSVGLSSIGSFTTSFRRMYGRTPTEYREAHPPASRLARLPGCVVRQVARPQVRTFREDAPQVAPVDSSSQSTATEESP
ncbi:AraC family transcriptional regulator [Nocardioides gansuensis]|uniref:AraC family transcriptional regulator n=1 Tax=Nocardioides gansuensis TaxID=2138300 RepID=A0A2T8FA93_9ACTN|nr:AraC family transcriptional regulator [Nocardioides gansuensis]PVG82636.1 AraC family transcriptional regulator [Nocardioides gansuensis]